MMSERMGEMKVSGEGMILEEARVKGSRGEWCQKCQGSLMLRTGG